MIDVLWNWVWEAPYSPVGWPDYVTSIATAITALTAVGALTLAWLSINEQARNSRVEKIADTLMECDRRYGQLREKILLTEQETESGCWWGRDVTKLSKHYERAFWALQFEQWQYFRLGLVPQESFSIWIAARVREFTEGDDTIFGQSYKKSWENANDSFANMSDFQKFINEVSQLENDSTKIKLFVEGQAEDASQSYKKFKENLNRFGNSKHIQSRERKNQK